MPPRCLSAARLDVVSEHPLRATSFQQTHDSFANAPQVSLALLRGNATITFSGLPPRRSDRRSKPRRSFFLPSVSTSSDRSSGLYRSI
jgi:hypothetical protein